MQPKHDLLVFSKKEILVVLVLLILVALFSFTIGLRLGKSLGAKESVTIHKEVDQAPLEEKAEDTPEGDEDEDDEGTEEEAGTPTPAKSPDVSAHSTSTDKAADALAEQRLTEKVKKEGIKSSRSITTSLPAKKKNASETVGYTLQVGAYKTVNEATEQVSILKRRNMDKAFYFEAEIPGKGTWFRVGIGVYKTKSEAEHAGQRLRAQGEVPSFIVQRIGE